MILFSIQDLGKAAKKPGLLPSYSFKAQNFVDKPVLCVSPTILGKERVESKEKKFVVSVPE